MFDSLFDSITLFDYWTPMFGAGRRGRKLLERGETATATITGIRVTRTGDSDTGTNNNHYAYALDVRTGTGIKRLACRQNLVPQRKLTHVGSEVQVRYRGDRVIIDWAATLTALGADGTHAESTIWWKPMRPRKAPAHGVRDHEQNGPRRRINGGTPGSATVLRITELNSNLFGGTLENVDVDVQLTTADGPSRQALLHKIIAPDYAHYLVTPGTVLPVGVDRGGERITVDWLAAVNGGATTDPAPPAAERDVSAPIAPTQGERLGGMLQGLYDRAMDSAGVPADQRYPPPARTSDSSEVAAADSGDTAGPGTDTPGPS